MQDKSWFCVWVKTGQEKEAEKDLRRIADKDDILCPRVTRMYKLQGEWQEREEVLIPGYVFIRCRIDADIYYRVAGMKSTIGWLSFDSMWPEIIPEEQMKPVMLFESGVPPEKCLTDVRLDRHKRRGYAVLHLAGKEIRITFGLKDKQTEEGSGDERPMPEADEQTDTTDR